MPKRSKGGTQVRYVDLGAPVPCLPCRAVVDEKYFQGVSSVGFQLASPVLLQIKRPSTCLRSR